MGIDFTQTFPGLSGATLYFSIDANGRRWNGTSLRAVLYGGDGNPTAALLAITKVAR